MSTPSPTSPPSPSAPSPPSNATSPPPSTSPPTNSTSPPPAAPPPTNSTSPPPAAPPPSTPSAPPPSTPSAPPPSTPSAPPPSTPSAPPPSTPSAPPPSTPSIPSSPPPSAPSNTSAPPQSTPSTPPPPHSVPPTPKSPSVPPPPNSTTPPAPHKGSPPSASQGNSKVSLSAGAVVGIAIGAAAILVLLCFLFACCRKRKRRPQSPPLDHYGGPPPMPPRKDDYGTQPQHWQHNAPPPAPADNIMKLPPQPPAPPTYSSRPPQFLPPPPPPPNFSSGSGSGSYNSGSEPLPPLNPKYTPGYVKSTFTYEELAMATNGFSDYNLLGQGGFGYVHKGVLPNGKEVAIKQLKAGSGQGEREFQAEVEIISRVHHRHLVSLVGYCISGDHRLLVYEYVPNKTLEFHLHGKDGPPMDWPTRLKIALGSAKGLAYLHEDCHPKIIHRDIKAANILLEMNFEAKVADFGLAKFTVENNTHVSTRVMGTFGYLAPEYASSGKLSDKSDVFSFGVMLLELITGKRPIDTTQTYTDDSLVEWARPLLQKAMEDDEYDELIDTRLGNNYNPDEMARMVACAASCVRHSARRRPKMSQIVRALEGHVSLEALDEGIRPGQSTAYGASYGSSEYDTMQYNEDLKKFKNIALASRDFTSSEYSMPTSEYGQIQSASSGEAKQTGEDKKIGHSS